MGVSWRNTYKSGNVHGDCINFQHDIPFVQEEFMIDFAEIVPISLTPEILEKNGFVPNTHVYPYPYYEYISEENKLKIGFAFPQGNRTSYKEPWVYIDSENVFIEHLPCMFVHQLQQAFRLCGLNDLADKFSV